MSERETNTLAASVKQRLLNRAQQDRVDFNLLLVRYATERLLFRLSVSPFASDFFLKGAMLFVLWKENPHRPTKDMDLLFNMQHDRQEIEKAFRQVASLKVEDDGLLFDPDSVEAEEIRDENAYGGVRIKLNGYIGSGRIPLQVDIGLGDAVYPEPDWSEFPTLLNFPPPRIRAYPIYTVVAEKFQAMVELQDRNSRMKDYFDLLYLQRKFEFSGCDLQEAINQTFHRRKTTMPMSLPVGLSEKYWGDEQKQVQWNAFLRKNHLKIQIDLYAVVEEIKGFLLPVIDNAQIDRMEWSPKEGWAPK